MSDRITWYLQTFVLVGLGDLLIKYCRLRKAGSVSDKALFRVRLIIHEGCTFFFLFMPFTLLNTGTSVGSQCWMLSKKSQKAARVRVKYAVVTACLAHIIIGYVGQVGSLLPSGMGMKKL